jgi:hypothetical protein
MSRPSAAINAFLCISLLLFPYLSFACKPKVNRISDYIQNRIPYHVIFLGTVLLVKHGKIDKGVSTQDIEFNTTRWLDPDRHLSIKVVDGKLPTAFLEQLKQQGLNF